MTRLLAFDTAGMACSVAVTEADTLLSHRNIEMSRGHAEALIPMIMSALADAETTFGELDGLAVTIGPGSFTGLRIGLAAARGIFLAANIPAMGLTNFELVLHTMRPFISPDRDILIAIDSKRADPYIQMFSSKFEPLSPPMAAAPENIPELINAPSVVVIGNAAGQVAAALTVGGIESHTDHADISPDARNLAHLASDRWSPPDGGQQLKPLYLRAPDTTKPGRDSRHSK